MSSIQRDHKEYHQQVVLQAKTGVAMVTLISSDVDSAADIGVYFDDVASVHPEH